MGRSGLPINDAEFQTLCAEVKTCKQCPRMMDSARVLSGASGELGARLMFLGEAPGRRGADSTEIPFHGDTSGHNFERLIRSAGISRTESFVSNAVLCNPKDERGNNSSPIGLEIRNCSGYLRKQIDLVNPLVVVTLGSVALKAVALIEPHDLVLGESVRTANKWYGRILIPMYHPGQRAALHRSFDEQREDYRFVAKQLGKRLPGKSRISIIDLACSVIREIPGVDDRELHQLCYLIEAEHSQRHHQRLTSALFICQEQGPYCVDLHPKRLQEEVPGLRIEKRVGRYFLREDLFRDAKMSMASIQSEVVHTLAKYKAMDTGAREEAIRAAPQIKKLLRASFSLNARIEFDLEK